QLELVGGAAQDRVELSQRAPADDRQASFEQTVEAGKQVGKVVGHHHGIRRGGNIEQRTVKVEEQARGRKRDVGRLGRNLHDLRSGGAWPKGCAVQQTLMPSILQVEPVASVEHAVPQVAGELLDRLGPVE